MILGAGICGSIIRIDKVVVVSNSGKNRGLLIGQSAFSYDEMLLLEQMRGTWMYAKEKKCFKQELKRES